MGTTPNLQLPYPEGTDQPAGHTQIKALAEKLDGTGIWCVASVTTTTGIGDAWTNVPVTLGAQVGGFTVSSGQIVVPADGVYAAFGFVRLRADGWTQMYGQVSISGASMGLSTVPNKSLSAPLSGTRALTSGDTVFVQARMDADGTATATGGQANAGQITIVRLGPTPSP